MKNFDTFRSLVNNIKRRPGMYIVDINYDKLVAFINGIDVWLSITENTTIMGYFQKWLSIKIGHDCSLHWSKVILQLSEKNNEHDVLKFFLNTIDEFYQYTDNNPQFLMDSLKN